MQEGRCRFNPCGYRDKVYVCGFGSSLIEAFDRENERFHTEKTRISGPYSCLLYVQNDTLVVHSNSFLLHFTSKSHKLKSTDIHIRSYCKIQNSINSQAVYAQETNAVYCVSDGKCYEVRVDLRQVRAI